MIVTGGVSLLGIQLITAVGVFSLGNIWGGWCDLGPGWVLCGSSSAPRCALRSQGCPEFLAVLLQGGCL